MREGTVGRDGATLEGVSSLGERSLLVAWRDHGPPDRRWRLVVDGAEGPAPRTGLALGAAGGGLRLLMAGLPTGRRSPSGPRLETLDGTASVPVDMADGAQLALSRLARGLDAPGRARLASWLLGTCPALLPAGGEADLALLCRDLLDALPPARRPAVRRCSLSDGWTLVEAAPAALGSHPEAFVLGLRRTVRGLVAPANPDADGSGLNPLSLAFEDPVPGEPGILVLVGRDGVACRRLAPARGPLISARAWLGAGTTSVRTRATALDLAALLDGRGLNGGSLTEELRLLVPAGIAAAPAAAGPVFGTLDFLAAGTLRLTLVGKLRDPYSLVAAIRLERLGAKLEVPRSDWAAAVVGPDTTFALTTAIPSECPHAPWRASLVLRSGATLDFGEGPTLAPPGERLALLLAAAAPLAAVPGVAVLLGPAAREAAAEHATSCRVGIVRWLGPSAARSRACLVLPFDQRDGAAARVVAMLADEPAKLAVEVLLLAPGPEAASRAGCEAEALAARHDLPIRLVVPTAPMQPLDLVRLGAEASEKPVLLTLGAGIVPRVRGWAGSLLTALDRWPELALAGLPVAGASASASVAGGGAVGFGPIPSLEAAALRRDALTRAGGLALDWLDLGCRDLDLVTRLVASGRHARVLPGPACVRLSAQIGRDDPARLAAILDAARPEAPRPVGTRVRRSRSTSMPENLQVAA